MSPFALVAIAVFLVPCLYILALLLKYSAQEKEVNRRLAAMDLAEANSLRDQQRRGEVLLFPRQAGGLVAMPYV